MSKACNRCKKEKPFSAFSKNSSLRDGYCADCKDCAKERAKNRYKKSGEKLRQQMANQRLNNYDHRIAIERASRERRKEFQRRRKNARQQIRNRLLTTADTIILDKELKKLYSSNCQFCNSTENLSIDHIIPLSRGGNHTYGNLMTLCTRCNSSKGNKLLVEWKQYLLKKRGD